MRGDTDDTVVLRKPRDARPRRRRVWIAAALVAAGVAAAFAVLPFGDRSGSDRPIRTADEVAIDANRPQSLELFRLKARPQILVLDFPTLAEQGRMLNRVAAFVEKRGAPHDRVLDDASLAAVIKADGDTPDTWYLGHDYRVGDLDRFFALADAQGIGLNADEERLRRILRRASTGARGPGAVITLPRADAGNGVTETEREVILHHELSHGDYFTDPAYAREVATTWNDVLTNDERAKVRAYLSGEEYDPALTDLMMNEMQAYVVYTPAGAFFSPERLGIPSDRLAVIRDSLKPASPSWLAPAN